MIIQLSCVIVEFVQFHVILHVCFAPVLLECGLCVVGVQCVLELWFVSVVCVKVHSVSQVCFSSLLCWFACLAHCKAQRRVLKGRRREAGEVGSARESSETDSRVRIMLEDMLSSLKTVRPSAMREVTLEVPKVSSITTPPFESSNDILDLLPPPPSLWWVGQVLWSDIGGQEEVKLCLKEAVERPIKHPEVKS